MAVVWPQYKNTKRNFLKNDFYVKKRVDWLRVILKGQWPVVKQFMIYFCEICSKEFTFLKGFRWKCCQNYGIFCYVSKTLTGTDAILKLFKCLFAVDVMLALLNFHQTLVLDGRTSWNSSRKWTSYSLGWSWSWKTWSSRWDINGQAIEEQCQNIFMQRQFI